MDNRFNQENNLYQNHFAFTEIEVNHPRASFIHLSPLEFSKRIGIVRYSRTLSRAAHVLPDGIALDMTILRLASRGNRGSIGSASLWTCQ